MLRGLFLSSFFLNNELMLKSVEFFRDELQKQNKLFLVKFNHNIKNKMLVYLLTLLDT